MVKFEIMIVMNISFNLIIMN